MYALRGHPGSHGSRRCGFDNLTDWKQPGAENQIKVFLTVNDRSAYKTTLTQNTRNWWVHTTAIMGIRTLFCRWSRECRRKAACGYALALWNLSRLARHWLKSKIPITTWTPIKSRLWMCSWTEDITLTGGKVAREKKLIQATILQEEAQNTRQNFLWQTHFNVLMYDPTFPTFFLSKLPCWCCNLVQPLSDRKLLTPPPDPH